MVVVVVVMAEAVAVVVVIVVTTLRGSGIYLFTAIPLSSQVLSSSTSRWFALSSVYPSTKGTLQKCCEVLLGPSTSRWGLLSCCMVALRRCHGKFLARCGGSSSGRFSTGSPTISVLVV